MAKYDVTYSCGHSGTVELFGPWNERQRKLEWFSEKGVCPECYKKQQAEWVAKTNEGFPQLVGTEKQIAWAEKIRAEMIAQYADEIEHIRKNNTIEQLRAAANLTELNGQPIPENHPSKIMAKRIINIMENTDAKWFIENRTIF